MDTLINNAGIMHNLNLRETRDLADVTREIDINLSGPLLMIQQFLPHLQTRPGALIINVSSGLAFVPLPGSPVYCATKAALHSYTQSLRVQLRGTPVTVINARAKLTRLCSLTTVVELAPPGTEMALFRGVTTREMKGPKPMDVTVLVTKAIAGIEAGKLEIRPGVANVLKLMSRVAPAFMLGQMAKMSLPKG